MMIRQGDVPLALVNVQGRLSRKERVNGRAVLAWGEATGHHHSTSDISADVFLDDQGREFFIVDQGATVCVTPSKLEVLEVPQFSSDPRKVFRVHTSQAVIRVDEERFKQAQKALEAATVLVWPGALLTHQEHDAIVIPPTMPGTAYTNPGQRSYVNADMPAIRVAD